MTNVHSQNHEIFCQTNHVQYNYNVGNLYIDDSEHLYFEIQNLEMFSAEKKHYGTVP